MTFPNTGYAPWILTGEDGITISQTGIYVIISGAGIPGALSRVFTAELTTDESIVAEAPTPPFTFPPGQPETLLSIPWTSVTGRVLITATFNGALQWDPAEIDPLLWLFLTLDGVDIQGGIVAITDNSAPSELQAITAESTLLKDALVTIGVPHIIELRWGVVGGVPDVSANIFTSAGNANHAVLTVQEIPLP